MPTPTYDLIASNVLGSSTGTVTFSSIPSTYRDLILIVEAKATVSTLFRARLNGDTGANYNNVAMSGSGTNTFSNSSANQTYLDVQPYSQLLTTSSSFLILQIFDYAQTDKHKSCLSRTNNAAEFVEASGHRWASTTAVNSVSVFTNANAFAAGSSFYLYGIVS